MAKVGCCKQKCNIERPQPKLILNFGLIIFHSDFHIEIYVVIIQVKAVHMNSLHEQAYGFMNIKGQFQNELDQLIV